jgi:hypothetical protein
MFVIIFLIILGMHVCASPNNTVPDIASAQAEDHDELLDKRCAELRALDLQEDLANNPQLFWHNASKLSSTEEAERQCALNFFIVQNSLCNLKISQYATLSVTTRQQYLIGGCVWAAYNFCFTGAVMFFLAYTKGINFGNPDIKPYIETGLSITAVANVLSTVTAYLLQQNNGTCSTITESWKKRKELINTILKDVPNKDDLKVVKITSDQVHHEYTKKYPCVHNKYEGYSLYSSEK